MDNLRCERQCEILNRPAYIVLFKGDDSDFTGNQTIYIDIETELDLTGFKAYFRFMDYEQTYLDITSKRIILVFPSSQTSKFPLGAADASLVIIDDLGKRRTVNNRIHIVVTNSVKEAYENEDPQSITVSVSGTYVQKQADWDETDEEDPSYIKNKPDIPAVVDPTPDSQSGQAADAKATGTALYTGFTEWVCDSISEGYEFVKCEWRTEGGLGAGWFADFIETPPPPNLPIGFAIYLAGEPDSVRFEYSGMVSFSISRHLVTPTKTSQLTNDGAPNGGGTPYATTAQVAAKQDALSAAQLANIAAVPSKANASDLPYALVTPGEWEFSGSGYDASKTYRVRFDISNATYAFIEVYDSVNDYWEMAASPLVDVSGTELSLSWDNGYITATRASLPGHLLDRAGNRVVVSGDATLTLPAANPGYIRDFLVRLEISGSTVPTITFAAPTGEEITYETDGDEFPVPDEAGTWLYSFTETAAHTFAVSLKKVNTVAQAAQGGS